MKVLQMFQLLIFPLLISLALVGFFNPACADGMPYISRLKVSAAQDQQLPLSDKINLQLVSANPEKIADAFKAYQEISINHLTGSSLDITLPSLSQHAGDFLPRHLQSSFVIDIDEPASIKFVQGFTQSVGDGWDTSDIRSYVHGYITDPSYGHGFHVASNVAQSRSGDCKAFAVLTTALSRALGLPARVVVGSLIFQNDSGIAAFGHAWSEAWVDGRWQIIDATMTGAEDTRIFYLPAGDVSNESSGFAMPLISLIAQLPAEIKNIRNAD